MKVWQIGISCVMLVLLVGCKSLGLGGKRVDYGAGATQIPALEVPPDLNAPASDERYRVPQGKGESVATFSEYSKGDAAAARDVDARAENKTVGGVSGTAGAVELRNISDGRRIIVVNDAFDRSWRRVGLAIERAGLAVEDKDRARGIYLLRPPKAENGWLDKLQFWKDDEGANMRYRVDIRDGGMACEVTVTNQNGVSDNASNLMIDAIYRNINQGGSATAPATVSAIEATGPAGTATMQEIFDGSIIIVINDAFDRSWNRLGPAIERAGLVVEGNDRDKGIYFLRPAEAESSLLDKLEFWRDKKSTTPRYQVNLKDGGQACEVSVTDQYGAKDDATRQMIEVIYKNIGQ